MVYLDTSFVAALVLEEAHSSAVAAAVQNLPAGQVCISDWTRVEFASTLARLVRMRELDAAAAAQTAERFERLITASFQIFLPTRSDFAQARQWLLGFRTTLRGGDALHLAVAAHHGVRALLTLDQQLIRAGRRLGVPVASTLRP